MLLEYLLLVEPMRLILDSGGISLEETSNCLLYLLRKACIFTGFFF